MRKIALVSVLVCFSFSAFAHIMKYQMTRTLESLGPCASIGSKHAVMKFYYKTETLDLNVDTTVGGNYKKAEVVSERPKIGSDEATWNFNSMELCETFRAEMLTRI